MKHFKFLELVDEAWFVSDRVMEMWTTWKETEDGISPTETLECVVALAKELAKPFVKTDAM